MKTKKTNKANLERYRGTFRQMGIVLALGLVFIAFEYTNADVTTSSYDTPNEIIVEPDYVPITKVRKELPPPPTIIFDKLIIDVFNQSIDEKVIIIDEIDPAEEIDFTLAEEGIERDDDSVFVIVENAPQFIGGDAALMRYLSENIIYPSIAQEVGIQGRVYVQFVVNKSGDITDVKLLKGIDRSLDAEALRVVQKMPRWKPGSQRGKNVNVSYQIPINFILR